MLWLHNIVLKQLHLAAINFQLLNLAIWFEIWKWLSEGRAVFGRFVNHIFAFHSSPVLNLISTLNWFDLASLKLKQGQYFFWKWDDETHIDGIEEVYRKRKSSNTSGKGDFIRFKLCNKQSPLSVHKNSDP